MGKQYITHSSTVASRIKYNETALLPETDSLYIELKPRPGSTTRELADGLVVDLDEQGEVVGFDTISLPSV